MDIKTDKPVTNFCLVEMFCKASDDNGLSEKCVGSQDKISWECKNRRNNHWCNSKKAIAQALIEAGKRAGILLVEVHR